MSTPQPDTRRPSELAKPRCSPFRLVKTRRKRSRKDDWCIPLLEFSQEAVEQISICIGKRADAEKFIAGLKQMLRSHDVMWAVLDRHPVSPANWRRELGRVRKAGEKLFAMLQGPVAALLKEDCEWKCDPNQQVLRLGPEGRWTTSCVRETMLAVTHLLHDIEQSGVNGLNIKGGAPRNKALWAIGCGVHTVFRDVGLSPSTTFMGPYEHILAVVLKECGQTYSDEHIHRLALDVHGSYKQRLLRRQQLRAMAGAKTRS